jgi:hypothetical protein
MSSARTCKLLQKCMERRKCYKKALNDAIVTKMPRTNQVCNATQNNTARRTWTSGSSANALISLQSESIETEKDFETKQH